MNILNNILKTTPLNLGEKKHSNLRPPFFASLARWLRFDSSTGIEDRIGDETRPIQPDGCITGDTTATVTFPTSVNGIKYAEEDFVYGSAIDVSSGSWVIPPVNVCSIKLYSDAACTIEIGLLPLQEQAGLTIFDVSGSENHATLSTDTVRNTTLFAETVLNDSNENGYNKAAYLYGTSSIQFTQPIIINDNDNISFYICPKIYNNGAIINGRKSNPNRKSGISWYNSNGFIIDALYADESGHFIGQGWYFSRPFTPNKWIKVTVSITDNVISMNRSDTNQTVSITAPKQVYLYLDNIGGRIQWRGRYIGYIADIRKNGISIDQLNGSTIGTPTNIDFNKIVVPNVSQTEDVFGRTPLYKGRVKFNAGVSGGVVGVFDGSSSYVTIPTINLTSKFNITIIFKSDKTASYIYKTIMSDGYSSNMITLSSSSPNSLTVRINNTSMDFHNITYFGVKKIEIVRDIMNVIKVYVDGTENADSYVNGDVFMLKNIGARSGSFFDGHIYYVNIDNKQEYYFNGHTIDSITGVAATNNGVTFVNQNEITTEATKDSLSKTVYKLATGELVVNPQFSLPSGAAEVKEDGYKGVGSIDFEGNASSPIGYLPHDIFNRLAYTGNPYGYPEIWDGDSTFLLDTDMSNPYLWVVVTPAYILAHINTAYEKYLYEYIKSGSLKDLVVYMPQRTAEENTKLIAKNWKPEY